MPEGDTVHKLAAELRSRLAGQHARALRIAERHGRTPLAPAAGGRVTDVFARGKHLFIEFDAQTQLRTHLGMYGSWHRYAPGETWRKPQYAASVVIETDADVFVCFNAKDVEPLPKHGIARSDFDLRLGPDLLQREWRPNVIVARAHAFADSATPINDVLLDQRVAAGIGNVYKSEILFLQGIQPLTALECLSNEQLTALYARARALLGRNLGGGPRITRFVDDGQGALWVYRRRGQACLRCGAAIQGARLGRNLRSTYWCPVCQR